MFTEKTNIYTQLFQTATFSTQKIPEGTDPLTLEIFAQLLDFYASDLEVELSVEKFKNSIKPFKQPYEYEWPEKTEKLWMGPVRVSDKTSG